MSDRILVTRIAVFAYHGLLEEEARLGQRFYISLDCRLGRVFLDQVVELRRPDDVGDIGPVDQDPAIH